MVIKHAKEIGLGCIAISTATIGVGYHDVWLGLNALLIVYWTFFYSEAR